MVWSLTGQEIGSLPIGSPVRSFRIHKDGTAEQLMDLNQGSADLELMEKKS